MGKQISQLSDDQLVVLLKQREPDAFVELTSRYMALIRAKAAPFRSSALETDDLCQEGLLGLLNAAESYSPGGKASFRTYAGVCIHNRMVTAYRTAASKKNIPLNNFVSLNSEEDSYPMQFTSEQTANPETLLIDRERLEGIKRCIRQALSKLEQQVLFLYLGGCSYAEIADELHITVKAADNAIQRIRHKLKEPS